MMATTHVFAGLAVVAPVAYAAPEFATPLAVGAILGGFAPDVDLVLEHRRALHFPVVGAVVAVPAVALATLLPTTATAALAAFAVVAWLHAASDAIGGGPEMDPWNDRTDRAVYDHVNGRWIRPRRWVRYDGAPEDAALAVALAVPALIVFDGWVQGLVVGGIVLSLVYALLRRRLIAWTPDWLE
ncbi:metal-dependent hydrolase [Natrarchaeobius chitinivorans]|uniref:Metal-dependent hydrolase n=1 Tax=Natrarchaeobius chitinivorans TaxID=1679083 RepID=A0A3N6MZP2_NATCH|nr:metal-dependent hydrolase [Natrarchaeobius chitinivorans]RQG91072.1 metal-dependent hydrolase [Natrarchaeobius chitinivorans]